LTFQKQQISYADRNARLALELLGHAGSKLRHMTHALRILALFTAAIGSAPLAWSASVDVVPPLPAPTGTIVNVSTEAQLQQAVAAIRSNTTIVLAPGTYTLTSTLWFNGAFTNIGIRGATSNRNDVVLVGRGMANSNYGSVPHGIWTGGGVQGMTIANLTIRDVYFHPIVLNGGTEDPIIYNVRLMNAGQQFIKANPDGSGGGADRGRVEYSIFEYSTTSRSDYTNAVDVHTGTGWAIRNNMFRNIRAPSGQLAGPAILVWNGSSNTTVEGNTFIDCQREISLGLIERTPNDHAGGVVRNNFIYRSSGLAGDAAILIADSANTRVIHNTILLNDGYPSPIEYRFGGSTGVLVANNLVNGTIQARDGASGTVTSNHTSAAAGMFVNPASGDLHLKATSTAAIDKASAAFAGSTDWDGDARPQGSAADFGADEFRSTTQLPPSPPTNLRVIR
jgi:Right handed beta helix region